MLKQSVIKEFNDGELNERYSAELASLSKMKMNHAISPLENPLIIRITRKNVARLATEITKRKNK
ncbi:MAG: 50S ribosomal protein L29 [Bacteroidota bacterium]|jgi:large subunit ribosomal protein L29